MQVHQRTELPHIVKKLCFSGFLLLHENIITRETHITEVTNTWTLDMTALASAFEITHKNFARRRNSMRFKPFNIKHSLDSLNWRHCESMP
jgi:hypothetical protein